ncbi:MAG: histidine phosphatase family protein [Rhizobiales bacterium]|nr:histidine phosphatase family protein [Hyphomicrobiales bacterium]
MKRLCLFRHAKSDWRDAGLNDFERPLNERGRKAADFMAHFIDQSQWRPDAVLCSTAVRARETFAPLQALLGTGMPVQFIDRLYHAMPDVLLEVIHAEASDDADTLLVIAHNPGLALMAADLAPAETDEAMAHGDGMPTGGFIVFEFDVDHWRDVKEHQGRLVFFGKPRQLMAEAK